MEQQRGQIALIVMLVMAVGLTVGLSAAQRATTSVSVSQTEKEGSKTYSAAEAGVEKALKEGLETEPSDTGLELGGINVSYTTSSVDLSDLGTISLPQDSILQMADGGSFEITSCSLGGEVEMEILTIESDGSTTREVAECQSIGLKSIPTGGLLRIRSIEGDVEFNLSGSPSVAQYFRVVSQAEAKSGETRAVEVTRSRPYLPAVFNYALFAGGAISEVD